MAIETNLGRELAEVISWLSDLPDQGPTQNSIARKLGMTTDAPLVLQLFGVLAGRLVMTQSLVEKLESIGEIDQDEAEDINEAIAHLAKVFSPNGLRANWATTKADARSEDEKAFRWFGKALGKDHRLYKLEPEEAAEALNVLEEIVKEMPSSTLPVWQRRAVVAGVENLTIAIRFMRWFGHEYTEGFAAVAAQRINLALQAITDDDPAKPALQKTGRLVAVILAVLGAAAAPDAALTAVGHYSEFFSGHNPWVASADAAPKQIPYQPASPEAGTQ